MTIRAPASGLVDRVVEHLSLGVILLDEELRVRFINPAAQAMFAVSARQVSDSPLRRFTPAGRVLERSAGQVLASGTAFTERELRLEVSEGRYITVDLSMAPLPHDEVLIELNHLDRRLRITRDQNLITQNQATRQLLRGLAHEIKNPLGGLRGAAQLLERELGNESLREYTQVIIEEADRLRTLVNGLLGPNTRPNKRQVNLHEILERVRQLVEAEAPTGVTVERDYDPSIPDMLAEPNQLIQATLNIVRNALQAVDQHGRITLRTRTQRQFTIGDIPHKLVARIDVTDTGPGIPPEILDHIFFPMVTSRPSGTGLGLSIAQTLVNQHGGLIECRSEPGETVFTIWLPLEAEHGG
ncbi:two-component system nitrogen regulation sensor histidine kinase GlnL [Natronocella acetinitrilica]|jgi:two-component system, NtrC family, nitrogen regulation sensor histidine kinase GlnL|uniref:Sensory histidine kinase/phosphatase NtrB n=1 Tax=Natronocella acetinitrilica TaxID=414046 RepID=A0AAE3G0C9_9GAMM|nr:nitrogen regulation protein NR(II) [Natronocella acetinitrilica]MCP1673360.1 two-component system nitrogen regulation sensor histidine kinase GlnL [Natronocella acetinitrilica]